MMESYDVRNAFRRKIMKSSLALAAGSALPRVAMGADAPVVLRCSSAMPVDQSSAQYLWFERLRECLRATERESVRSRMQAQLWPGFTASYPATRPLLAAIEAARA